LPNGNYVVRLHFAEVYWGAPGTGAGGGAGSRIMSVKLENQLRLSNFDIVREVGSGSALIKNFPVTVTDGKLNIDFSASVNRPSVSAIEVYSFTGLQARPAMVSSIAPQPLIAANESFKVFPNPVHNIINIEFPNRYNGNTSVQIVDMLGKKYQVAKTMLVGERPLLNLDISRLSLNTGIYFLKVDTEGKKSEVIKLIIR
jgi:hypothetical protein